jgi:hypothetical protein
MEREHSGADRPYKRENLMAEAVLIGYVTYSEDYSYD